MAIKRQNQTQEPTGMNSYLKILGGDWRSLFVFLKMGDERTIFKEIFSWKQIVCHAGVYYWKLHARQEWKAICMDICMDILRIFHICHLTLPLKATLLLLWKLQLECRTHKPIFLQPPNKQNILSLYIVHHARKKNKSLPQYRKHSQDETQDVNVHTSSWLSTIIH